MNINQNTTTKIIQDAFLVSKFVKNNDYPNEGESKFFEFSELLHNLECSLRDAGIEVCEK